MWKLPTKTVAEVDHAEAGRIIKALRKRHRLSLRELSRRMDFSAPFVSDLERGRRNWTEQTFNDAVKAIRNGK